MNWFFDNIQFFVILLIVAVSLISKVLEAAKSRQKPGDTEGPTIEDIFGPDFDFGGDPDSPQEAGPPPLREPYSPPPLRRVTVAGPAPELPPPLPDHHQPQVAATASLGTMGAAGTELDLQRAIQDRFQQVLEARAVSRPDEAAPLPVKRPAVRSGSLKGRLHSNGELRRAFVMKEILDRPLGLR